MLDLVPDLRPALETADPEELAEILDAFDIIITYGKQRWSSPPPSTKSSPDPSTKTDRHAGGRGYLP
jgi:hypothetical protein